MLAHRHLDLLSVDSLATHHIGEAFAVLHDDSGCGREQVVEPWQPVQPAHRVVGEHERDDQDEAADQRRVRPGDGRLQRVGHEQDEDQVIQRELTDLSFPEQPQRHQQRGVDDDAAKRQLPRRDAGQQLDRVRGF